ncbi:hypothetical protein NIES3807_35380 [Microcystis aeruginosa NIES-3807]|uniref:Uncharacterized protein n=1 Tax=Microcystis aeruginosa NIES-3807 TaxID=2517785 RepID=A0AAD3B399_MICAE|nr:hypothetical protein NIES3807_35380 [Microcystis aeruginosa NIES-3807]
MDPLTGAAIAVGSIIATKALEKTGEKVGEKVWEQTEKFLTSLKQVSPDTVTAIEKAPEQPLDYGQAILEVESVAKTSPELSQIITELVDIVESEPLPNLKDILNNIAKGLQSQSSGQKTYIKTIEKLLIFLKGTLILMNKISPCNVLGACNAPRRNRKKCHCRGELRSPFPF